MVKCRFSQQKVTHVNAALADNLLRILGSGGATRLLPMDGGAENQHSSQPPGPGPEIRGRNGVAKNVFRTGSQEGDD